MNTLISLSVLLVAVALATPVTAQVRSNIQDDPRSSDCTEGCIDAGYEWAMANTPEDERDCEAANAEFAAGCDHWVQEQRDLAQGPLEEPVATDAAGPMYDDAGPLPEETMPPAEDYSAPLDEAPVDEAPLDEAPLEEPLPGGDNGL